MSVGRGRIWGHAQPLLLTNHVTLGRSLHLSEMILIFLAFSLTSAHPKTLIRMSASPCFCLCGWAPLPPHWTGPLQFLYSVLSFWSALSWCSPSVGSAFFSSPHTLT